MRSHASYKLPPPKEVWKSSAVSIILYSAQVPSVTGNLATKHLAESIAESLPWLLHHPMRRPPDNILGRRYLCQKDRRWGTMLPDGNRADGELVISGARW